MNLKLDQVAKKKKEENNLGGAIDKSNKTELVIFCIDVSGSMNSTTKIPELQAEWMKLNNNGAPKEYISRLECIQLAVQRQLERLQLINPNKRVVLITFDNQINILGDGNIKTKRFALPIVKNSDEITLREKGKNAMKGELLLPIQESFESISSMLKNLEAGSSTALGPALCVSCGLASNYDSAEVIICTDGVPNVGVGSAGDESLYENMGKFAREQKTKISIIGIEGGSVAICCSFNR